MITRLLVCVVAGMFLLSANGCMVAENVYLKKVEESDALSKELTELQQTHKKLLQENALLKTKYVSLTEDAAILAADKKQLEGILKAKSDILSKNINELRQQVAGLKAENSTLSDGVNELQKAKDQSIKDVSGTYEQLLVNMKNEIAQGQVTIAELRGKLTVSMEAAILFDSGKADVKAEGFDLLNKMVEMLKSLSGKAIRVEGHTDVAPLAGTQTRTFPTNWELSAARAISVTRFLQQQGVDPHNLSAAACAEYKPVADNSTKEGRAKNRRIEISLMMKE